MDLSKLFGYLTIKDIPKECHVIRIKNQYRYIHISNNGCVLSIKDKMKGCFVLINKTSSDAIIKSLVHLDLIRFGCVINEYESVPFFRAYLKHGITESINWN